MERIMEKMQAARAQRSRHQNEVQHQPREILQYIPPYQKLSWLLVGVVLGVVLITTALLIGKNDNLNRRTISEDISKRPIELVGQQAESSSINNIREDIAILSVQVQKLTASITDLKVVLDSRAGEEKIAILATENESDKSRQQIKTSETGAILDKLPAPAAGFQDVRSSENTGTPRDSINRTPSTGADNPPAATRTIVWENNRESGPWAINLVSLPQKENAVRFVARAKSRGIDTKVAHVTVKGRDYWRVYVSGFATAAEAQSNADVIKEKLGLKDVWVAKN